MPGTLCANVSFPRTFPVPLALYRIKIIENETWMDTFSNNDNDKFYEHLIN